MAIYLTPNDRHIPVAEARDFLQYQTDNFGCFIDIDRCYELCAMMSLDMTNLTLEARELTRSSNLLFDNKQAVIQKLIDFGVNPMEFAPKGKNKSGDLSHDAKVATAIANNPGYSPEAKKLNSLYSTYKSTKRNRGNIYNFANQPIISTQLSKRGHRMAIARPTWNILSTSRLAAEEPGVQGIPKTMGDIICEPKGYTLIRCDSGQIEPRIIYSVFVRDELIMNLILEYNDAYYGLYHYATMSTATEDILRRDFKNNFKKLDTEVVKGARDNLKKLSNAGNYGSSNLDLMNNDLADLYEVRIVNHPLRKAWEQRVRKEVAAGADTFYSAFGTPITPGSTERYEEGAGNWHEHLVRCGINNPVQATASDLMLFSIEKAREVLSRAKDSHICFYKHDEACFYVSDEDMANGIGDELKDIASYHVEGWIPIDADPLIGVKPGGLPSYIL